MAKKYSNSLEYCPKCNSNLQGDIIPKKDRWMYKATHFSRKIGIYSLELDRTTDWKCPDCNHLWKRGLGEKIRKN